MSAISNCNPTCATFGGHAFDCPNHPCRATSHHCPTCTCIKEKQ